MLRDPRARGPNSIRPSNQPTIFSSASRVILVEPLIRCPDLLQVALDVLWLVGGTEVCPPHAVAPHGRLAWGTKVPMPGQLRGSQCPAGVTSRRLNPDLLERPLPEQSAVPDAIQGHSSGEAEVGESGLAAGGLRHPQHDLFADDLHRARQVHLFLGQLGFGNPRRAAKEAVERGARHRETAEIVEVLLVQAEGAVVPQVEQFAIDEIDVLRLPVRGQPHHLVLARIDLESGVVRERRVQQPQRIRPAQLVHQRQVRALPDADGGGGPLAHAIHRENGRFREWRGVEGAGRVRLMVFGIEHFPIESQRVADLPLHVELVLDPERAGHEERLEAAGCHAQVSLQDALELEQRLVVERHRRQLVRRDPGLFQAVVNRMLREPGIALDPAESLLAGGGNDFAVSEQAGRAVVIEGGNAKNVGRCRLGHR
jgi:hypothetical protein